MKNDQIRLIPVVEGIERGNITRDKQENEARAKADREAAEQAARDATLAADFSDNRFATNEFTMPTANDGMQMPTAGDGGNDTADKQEDQDSNDDHPEA